MYGAKNTIIYGAKNTIMYGAKIQEYMELKIQ